MEKSYYIKCLTDPAITKSGVYQRNNTRLAWGHAGFTTISNMKVRGPRWQSGNALASHL